MDSGQVAHHDDKVFGLRVVFDVHGFCSDNKKLMTVTKAELELQNEEHN